MCSQIDNLPDHILPFIFTYTHTYLCAIAPKKQVKDIFVVGHYQCGGIKAAMEDKARYFFWGGGLVLRCMCACI